MFINLRITTTVIKLERIKSETFNPFSLPINDNKHCILTEHAYIILKTYSFKGNGYTSIDFC